MPKAKSHAPTGFPGPITGDRPHGVEGEQAAALRMQEQVGRPAVGDGPLARDGDLQVVHLPLAEQREGGRCAIGEIQVEVHAEPGAMHGRRGTERLYTNANVIIPLLYSSYTSSRCLSHPLTFALWPFTSGRRSVNA